jgi:hypothetical protein
MSIKKKHYFCNVIIVNQIKFLYNVDNILIFQNTSIFPNEFYVFYSIKLKILFYQFLMLIKKMKINYKLNSDVEPTDEQLNLLMVEVVNEVKRKAVKTNKIIFEQLFYWSKSIINAANKAKENRENCLFNRNRILIEIVLYLSKKMNILKELKNYGYSICLLVYIGMTSKTTSFEKTESYILKN